jgi:hypothetical protein
MLEGGFCARYFTGLSRLMISLQRNLGNWLGQGGNCINSSTCYRCRLVRSMSYLKSGLMHICQSASRTQHNVIATQRESHFPRRLVISFLSSRWSGRTSWEVKKVRPARNGIERERQGRTESIPTTVEHLLHFHSPATCPPVSTQRWRSPEKWVNHVITATNLAENYFPGVLRHKSNQELNLVYVLKYEIRSCERVHN